MEIATNPSDTQPQTLLGIETADNFPMDVLGTMPGGDTQPQTLLGIETLDPQGAANAFICDTQPQTLLGIETEKSGSE